MTGDLFAPKPMVDSTDTLPRVHLYTDGACLQNPGPGGWGYILNHPDSGKTKQDSGGEAHTTNNRMEISAVIHGLGGLRKPSAVDLYCDSEYVVHAIREWMTKWKSFGWYRTAKRRTKVKNVDLWQQVDALLQIHEVNAIWVKGHAGHPENEKCDALANLAAAQHRP